MVIDHGRVIADGTPEQLKSRIGGAMLSVRIARPENRERALGALSPLCTGQVEVSPDAVAFSAPIIAGDGVVPGVIRALDDAGVDVLDVEVRKPSLDDVFSVLTGHTAGSEGEP